MNSRHNLTKSKFSEMLHRQCKVNGKLKTCKRHSLCIGDASLPKILLTLCEIVAWFKKDQQCFYHDNQTGLETTGKSSGHIQTLPLVQVHTSHGSHKHGQTSNFPSWQQNLHPEVMWNLLYPPHVKKDCYKHSFLPRTMTEWNLLPPNIRQSTSVDSLKSKLNNMDLTSFIRGAHY